MGLNLLFFLATLLVVIGNAMRGASIAAPATVLALFLLALLCRTLKLRKDLILLNQLKSYRRELRQGGTVAVDSMLLRYDSTLTSYTVSVGFLVFNIEIPSGYRLFQEQDYGESFLYSLLTLATGWWSLNGPWHTIHTVLENSRGGRRGSVAMLIDGPRFRETNPATTASKT
ncbi:MAG: hypothetical protein KDD69_08525 [Bdellovibrionales bacterium]|nr:hypothetical protein [Bdellovibrionales bacterium]